ncbi:SH3 domain-binding glutamic acid-rich protein -like protein, partial [Caligus rogercresseyi]
DYDDFDIANEDDLLEEFWAFPEKCRLILRLRLEPAKRIPQSFRGGGRGTKTK